MQNKKQKIFKILLFMLIFFLFRLQPVHAEEAVAQLTLHTYGNSLTGSSNGDVGHAFLSIENKTNRTLNFLSYPIFPKETISVSIWPDKMSPIKSGGVYINWEMVACKNINNVSISIDITQQQLEKIASNTPKESYYHDGMDDIIPNIGDDAWHNCTTYSTKMWNLVAPKKYKITDGFLGIDAPKWISKKIKNMQGHQEGMFTVSKKTDTTDIFYITKTKELVPIDLEIPSLALTNVSENTVSLKWSSSKKKLLDNKSNITGYQIRFSPEGETQQNIQDFSSETATIHKLKYGIKYAFEVRAFYKKGSYTIYSDYSKSIFATIPSASKSSIKLNKTSLLLNIGNSTFLKATVTGTSPNITWKSDNNAVAIVSNKGKVTGKKAGTCKIIASANGKKAVCTVTVRKTVTATSTYKKLLNQYETKYGKAKTGYIGGVFYWKGLCFVKLLDFNGDGTKELLLAYQTENSNANNIKYHVEMWTFDGKKAKKIVSSISWTGNNGPLFGYFSINKYKGKYYLHLTDDAGRKDYYYGTKNNNELGAVHKFIWKGDAIKGQWYYNGKAISVQKYQNYYNLFNQNKTSYSFSSFQNEALIKNEISKTKKNLK